MDFNAVVPVIRESGVDVGGFQLRESSHDLVDGSTLQLVPDVDVLNANSRTRDTCFATANPGFLFDMV